MAPPHALAPTDIAIICLYRAQVQRVREKLGCFGGAGESILVGTVDACQGQERSVVVLTTCASQGGGGGAHLERPQRLCVALSRAKSHLLIVGGATALWQWDTWRTILHAAAAQPSGLRSTSLRPLLSPGPRLSIPNAGGSGAS